MQMPQMERGNRYVIVFMDYLTKCVKAFATEYQTSETIARLLVDHIVCRHGVPVEPLSDRGPNLLSNLIQDVCSLLSLHKINTTAYHPQCDGLVENFNQHCSPCWPSVPKKLDQLVIYICNGSLCISSQATLLFGRITLESCLWSGSSHSN